jgi:hypothetical protein
MSKSPVTRYDAPGIHAVNFVLEQALAGGGMASRRLDPLAKGFAQMLLDFPIARHERNESGMDLNFTSGYDEFRGQLRDFLKRAWRDAGENPKDFRRDAVKAGYLYRAFPKVYGGSERESDAAAMRSRLNGSIYSE